MAHLLLLFSIGGSAVAASALSFPFTVGWNAGGRTATTTLAGRRVAGAPRRAAAGRARSGCSSLRGQVHECVGTAPKRLVDALERMVGRVSELDELAERV